MENGRRMRSASAHCQNDRVIGGITVFTARPSTKLPAQNRVVRIRRIYGETLTRMASIFTRPYQHMASKNPCHTIANFAGFTPPRGNSTISSHENYPGN